MKRLISITTLTFLALSIAGCGKQETAPAQESPAVEAEAPESVTQTAEIPAVAETESLEVVEESAAEAEPADQAIMLAQADDVAAARTWQFKEGQHYTRMVPTQRTVGGADKIEVAEVFMYSCPHCFDLEAFVNQWEETKDPGVRLVRIPAIFNQLAQLHAQLYYTELFLAQSGKLKDQAAFRNMVFEEFHRKGNRLTSETAIQRLFTRAGVSEDDFKRTWSSFEVNQAMRVAQDLARRYNVTSVPMIVVNGKYRTDAGQAGSYPKLIELIDELTVREGLR
ncbi:MAG: thioredoxin domain-containing protein [Gammaproteobacteria bacterium]|jgi:thiol:disulfide interchange protein DsbA|nr:thioredoxin domain-containing protein [Gammaproteobacteria bacterium]